MTGVAVRTETGSRAPDSSWRVLLEPAFSSQTMEITHRIQALQNSPSPGSLRPEADAMLGEKPLHECLFDALAEVKILTSQVAMHLDGEWRGRLFRQLDSLHDPAEWEQGDQPIHQSSFATFLKAMLSINPERRPGLGLSHAGHLLASWVTDQDRLTIEFLPTDRIRWVLSRRYDGDTERFAGDTGVARLAESLAIYHPEHWFSHVKKNHKLAR